MALHSITMTRPAHQVLVMVTLGLAVTARAQQPAGTVPANQPAVAQPAEAAATPATAPVYHNYSQHIGAILAASAPKYTPAPKTDAATDPALTPTLARDKPSNGIVRLPDYVVRDGKLPTPEEVRTRKETARIAMNRYLGPSDGFDRGFLNAFTIADLWRKIPLIGQILPCPIPSISNEDRAMIMYEEDERLRKMKDLMSLAALAKQSGDAELARKIEHETNDTFRRYAPWER